MDLAQRSILVVSLQNLNWKKKQVTTYLLDTEDDAQHLTWIQLGIEVGIESTEVTIRASMKDKVFVDGIQKQRGGI